MLVVPSPALSTVVIVTWRGNDHIGRCLDAVAAQRRPHRTIVIDNASDDGTARVVARHASAPTVLRLSSNAGYAGGIQTALGNVDTPYIAWLNDDAAPSPDWLGLLEEALNDDDGAAAVGARLESPGGRTLSTGVGLSRDGHGNDLNGVMPGEVFGFCGGAALVRADALRAIGGVPPEFFCYYEDTDTSWRLRLAGWRVLAVPSARVQHLHGASTRPGSADFHLWNERNRLLMLLRCAPVSVVARELARFVGITVLLPLRRTLGADRVPEARNFRVRLRLRALAGVLARLPAALRARAASSATPARRREVWTHWAGR